VGFGRAGPAELVRDGGGVDDELPALDDGASLLDAGQAFEVRERASPGNRAGDGNRLRGFGSSSGADLLARETNASWTRSSPAERLPTNREATRTISAYRSTKSSSSQPRASEGAASSPSMSSITEVPRTNGRPG